MHMGVLTFKYHLKDERSQITDVMQLYGTINKSNPVFPSLVLYHVLLAKHKPILK